MAWLFVGLKLRITTNALRGAGWRAAVSVVSALLAVVMAAIGFLSVAVSRGTDAGDVLAVLTMAIVVVGWVTLPVLGFGTDASLDPSFLTTLPLRRAVLMRGLVAASLVGLGSLITAATAAGAVVAFAHDLPGTVLLLLAAAVQVGVCVTLSRALVTWMSGALRSRRGRDLRIVAVLVIALAPQALRFVLPQKGDIADYRHATRVLAWFPALWPTKAMVGVGQGELLGPLLLLVGGTGVLLGLTWWWAHGIDRITTTAEAAARTATSDRGRTDTHEPLFGALLARLPRNRVGAVAAKEVRLAWRDPRRRMNVVSGLLLPFILLIGLVSRGGFRDPTVVYTSVIVVALGGSRAFNQLGLDGRAWAMNEAAGSDLAADLDGKALATALVQLPLVLVVAVILAIPSHGWSAVVPSVLLALALAGVQLGLGNITSVLVPFPMPASATSVWGTSTPGMGCLSGLVSLAAVAVMAVISAPFVVACLLVQSDAGRTVIGLVALPFGLLAYRLLTRVGVARGRRRAPEILEALSLRPTAR